jgi:hypothetical protein
MTTLRLLGVVGTLVTTAPALSAQPPWADHQALMDTRTMAVAASARQGGDPKKDEADVRKADQDRFAAMVKGDIALLDRLLAVELTYTHGDARRIDKSGFLADFKTGAFRYSMIEPSDVMVTLYGDVAVVTGAAAMRVLQNGTANDIRIRYTNVHVKRNGAWQMVAWQATRLPATP